MFFPPYRTDFPDFFLEGSGCCYTARLLKKVATPCTSSLGTQKTLPVRSAISEPAVLWLTQRICLDMAVIFIKTKHLHNNNCSLHQFQVLCKNVTPSSGFSLFCIITQPATSTPGTKPWYSFNIETVTVVWLPCVIPMRDANAIYFHQSFPVAV